MLGTLSLGRYAVNYEQEVKNYFQNNSKRKNALSEVSRIDIKLQQIREFQNEYRSSTIILFDADDVPISLDLHGFKSGSAKVALSTFIDFAKKFKLKKFHIIYGHGEVLSQLVDEYLEEKLSDDYYICDDYGYVVLENNEESGVWSNDFEREKYKSKNIDQPISPATWRSSSVPQKSPNNTKDALGQSIKRPEIQAKVRSVPAKDTPNKFMLGVSALFSGIGSFLGDIAEGWRQEELRRAEQQRRYEEIYASKKGLFSVILALYARILGLHFAISYVLFFSAIAYMVLAVVGIFPYIFGFSGIYTLLSFVNKIVGYCIFDLIIPNKYILIKIYFVNFVIFLFVLIYEQKKFYSAVPKECRHEVEFKWF